MTDLLFLAHRIPYPPNKGDKIRSYHFLRGLAERYRVHLGAFVDDPDDWQHEGELRKVCASVRLVPIRPKFARVKALIRGLATGQALSLPYFDSSDLRAWVDGVLATGRIERVFVYSSPMAQFVLDRHVHDSRRTVVDFVDVDSDKWRQYADKKAWPISALYAREARLLSAFERDVARRADASVFVSPAEAEFFRTEVAPPEARIVAVENGVDTEYFSPERDYPDPYDGHQPVIVFTGAMDYWANVDAVTWFANEVLPGVRREVPEASFWIVGSRPTESVKRLASLPGVRVTGTVPDVRPFLAHAAVAVAPLRIARGIQNKVLEAMAMARPVVASPQAMDGLDLPADASPVTVDEAPDWVRQVAARAATSPIVAATALRDAVVSRYAWDSKVQRISDLMETGAVAPAG